MTTKARVLWSNDRRSDLPELRAARRWPNRRGEFMRAVRDIDPSIIGSAECTKEQAEYKEAQLGRDRWAYFGGHNVRVFVDVTKWRLLNWWGFDLEAGKLPPGARHLVVTHLQRIDTGDTALFAATHLTPHNIAGAQSWRVKQMHQICAILPTLPDSDKVVLMGDINDTSKVGGVRGAAGEHGLKSLRSRHIDSVYDFGLNSFNGWKDSVAKAIWLDEIFTTLAVKPYLAGIERTDTKRPLRVCASDHNWLRASVEFTGGLDPA
jgi:hypothetical protein